jgi:hypothetical protein
MNFLESGFTFVAKCYNDFLLLHSTSVLFLLLLFELCFNLCYQISSTYNVYNQVVKFHNFFRKLLENKFSEKWI